MMRFLLLHHKNFTYFQEIKLKDRVSKKLQQEKPDLSKRYWSKHFWAIGYGAWSTGNLTDELVQEYLEHHRSPSNQDANAMILE